MNEAEGGFRVLRIFYIRPLFFSNLKKNYTSLPPPNRIRFLLQKHDALPHLDMCSHKINFTAMKPEK